MKTLALAVCAALTLYASTAVAAPLDLTEVTDFDLTFTNVGTLDLGLNSVKGAVVGPDDSFDTFQMILPAGLTIKKGQLIITNYESGCDPCDLDLGGRVSEPLNETTFFFNSGTFPLTGPFSKPGDIDAEVIVPSSFSGGIGFEGSYDYDLQYEVGLFTGQPGGNVPEPGTFLMLAGGAIALALRRRRPHPIR